LTEKLVGQSQLTRTNSEFYTSLVILSVNLLPEPLIRLAVMVSLTIAFGGLGFIFIAAFFDNTNPLRPFEYFGMAIAVGPALVILLVGGLSFLGIPLTKSNLSITLLGSCGVSIIRLFIKRSKIRIQPSFSGYHDLIENILPISLFFILLFLRLIQIRDVFVPNWYDGFIHTSLLQEFTMKSAIPFDNIYQIGFHAIALVVHSFWELPSPEAILLTGQWLSAVCGLSFYMFARRHIHNAYAAGLSLAAYSLFLRFPSYLIPSGHYPYLLGLALLPPAILTSLDWITSRRSSFSAAFVFVISLALTHYGSLVIWFSFILVYVINQIVFGRKLRPETLGNRKEIFFRPLLLISPALILILSKAFDPLHQYIIQENMLSQMYDPDFGFGAQYVLKLFRTHDYFFILLWIFWVSWSFVWKRKLLYITLFWPLAIWFLIWIQYQVIGNSISTYGNLIVFLSIPLALCFGLFAQQLLLLLMKLDSSDKQPLSRHLAKSRLSILLIIGILVGVSSSPLSIDQNRVLFTNDDMVAMNWISASTAKDSGFLIRTTSWYNDALVPSDGGGWIPLLTGRRTIIPQVGELYDICEFAADHGANYIYFGKQTGYDRFDLRLSDLNVDSYDVVYGSHSVEIVSLRCP